MSLSALIVEFRYLVIGDFFAISILIYTYFHKDYLFPNFQLGIETVEINTLMDRCDFVDASLPSSPPAGATCPAVDASGPCAGVACRFGSSPTTIVALMVIWSMTFYHIAWRIFVIAFSYEHTFPPLSPDKPGVWSGFMGGCLSVSLSVSIVGTLCCVIIDNETNESGVTKYTRSEAWSAFRVCFIVNEHTTNAWLFKMNNVYSLRDWICPKFHFKFGSKYYSLYHVEWWNLMKQSVNVGAQLLWKGRYGYNQWSPWLRHCDVTHWAVL